ncbi:hypothetical protein D9M71_470230 [compost metagenome]
MALVQAQGRPGRIVRPLVHLRVEDLDDRLADGNGLGNPDRLVEQADQLAADEGFTGTGGAVDHDRPSGIQRRAELVEQAVVQHHALEGSLHGLGVDATVVDGLGKEQFAVAIHGIGRRADIAAARQRIAGRAATAVGKPVAQAAAGAVILTEHLDPTILAQKGQQLVEHRPGKRQALHQPGGIQAAGVVQVFAEQIDQQRFGKSGFRHAAWLCHVESIITGTIPPGLLDPGYPRQVHGLLPGIYWFFYMISIKSASSTGSTGSRPQ